MLTVICWDNWLMVVRSYSLFRGDGKFFCGDMEVFAEVTC
jgi:hypothetical protein